MGRFAERRMLRVLAAGAAMVNGHTIVPRRR